MPHTTISRQGDSTSPLASFAVKNYSAAKRLALRYAASLGVRVKLEYGETTLEVVSFHDPQPPPKTHSDRMYELGLRIRKQDALKKAYEPYGEVKTLRQKALDQVVTNESRIERFTAEIGHATIAQSRLTSKALASLVAVNKSRTRRLGKLNAKLTEHAEALRPLTQKLEGAYERAKLESEKT